VTQAMADGQLGKQVEVRGKDEIGRLASSFNQMSQDLENESKIRRQMTADIAHDLRTPLSVLYGYLEALKDEDLQGNPALYQLLFDETKQLGHLINELHTLSLADAGELPLNCRPISPHVLLERVGMAFMMQAQQKEIDLIVTTPHYKNLPMVHADLERIMQVMNNLVSNALRYTMTGKIKLSAEVVNGGVSFQITDTGKGIEVEKLPFVFDRFYRTDSSRARTESEEVSSGLGLAIAKAIIDVHGGIISAHSKGLGTGTTMQFVLPLAT